MADRRTPITVPESIAGWHAAARRRHRAASGAVALLAALCAVGIAGAPREGVELPRRTQQASAGAVELRSRLIAREDSGPVRLADRMIAPPRELPKPFLGRLAVAEAAEPARRPGKAKNAIAAVERLAGPAEETSTRLLPLLPPAGVLTSRFSSSRLHPILGIRRPHLGVDIRSAYGTPILAPSGGTVRTVAWEGGFGLTLEIDHGNGVLTRYAHCSRAFVKVGQTVARGDRIAAVGRSGITSGPHLHYEVQVHGRSVDPLTFAFPDWSVSVDSLGIPNPALPGPGPTTP